MRAGATARPRNFFEPVHKRVAPVSRKANQIRYQGKAYTNVCNANVGTNVIDNDLRPTGPRQKCQMVRASGSLLDTEHHGNAP